MRKLHQILAWVVLILGGAVVSAHASLSTDLQSLATQGAVLRSSLANISISQGATCTQLGTLNTSVENYLASMQAVYNQLTVPLTLTTDELTSLDDLSAVARDMASDSVRIALELKTLDGAANLFEYRAALSAMLRLSDDIGTMANRILEMADRILTMADNIGLMADRILATQRLQSANMALTQASLLTTQQNMIALSGSLSTIGYNLTLGLLLTDTNLQIAEMNGITLNTSNMATQLSYVQTKTALLMARNVALYDLILRDSQRLSHYIDGDTLSRLADLSAAQKQLALMIERYAATINQLAPLTQTPILSDATRSMLRLAADIATMSKRIVEMSDKIIVMADNIGIMSGRIVETETIQQANIELTQQSILTAQNATISVIKTYLGQ